MAKFYELSEDANQQADSSFDFDMDYPREWQGLQFEVLPAFQEPPSEWIEKAHDAGAAIFGKLNKDFDYEVIMRAFGPAVLIFGQNRRIVVEIEIRRFPMGKWPIFLVKTFFEGREKNNDKLPKRLFAYMHHQYEAIRDAMQQCHEWGIEWYKANEQPHYRESIQAYEANQKKIAVLAESAKQEMHGVGESIKKKWGFSKKAVVNSRDVEYASKFPTLKAAQKASALLGPRDDDEDLLASETLQETYVEYGNEYVPQPPAKRRLFDK